MKSNNKGFTMVELLAVIIIMGILMGIGLPILTNMINNNRKKEYVSDATKMVARAEYFMTAKSSSIVRPDSGDAIVMNLKYLDDGSFSSAPYGGKYDFETSFVVIKANGNELEYYVMLVEKTPRNTYMGIELVDGNDLDINKVVPLNNTYSINSSTPSANVRSYIINATSAANVVQCYF